MAYLGQRMRYAGTLRGPENSVVPNITPHKTTGIGQWRIDDLVTYLESGMRPDGDTAEGLMSDVIDYNLQFLHKEDLAAIFEFLQSQSAIENKVQELGYNSDYRDWQ